MTRSVFSRKSPAEIDQYAAECEELRKVTLPGLMTDSLALLEGRRDTLKKASREHEKDWHYSILCSFIETIKAGESEESRERLTVAECEMYRDCLFDLKNIYNNEDDPVARVKLQDQGFQQLGEHWKKMTENKRLYPNLIRDIPAQTGKRGCLLFAVGLLLTLAAVVALAAAAAVGVGISMIVSAIAGNNLGLLVTGLGLGLGGGAAAGAVSYGIYRTARKIPVPPDVPYDRRRSLYNTVGMFKSEWEGPENGAPGFSPASPAIVPQQAG